MNYFNIAGFFHLEIVKETTIHYAFRILFVY